MRRHVLPPIHPPRSCRLHVVRRQRGVTNDDNDRAPSVQLSSGVLGSHRGRARPVACGDAVLTVGTDPAGVEARLSSALLCCPGCGGRLAPWGMVGFGLCVVRALCGGGCGSGGRDVRVVSHPRVWYRP
jgi:hypothetical protein